MEASGARVVPILFDEDLAVIDELLPKLNGVLFPGGNDGYLKTGEHIFKWAMDQNDKGNYYPIWGTCVGYENMAVYVSSSGAPLTSHYCDGESLTMDFIVDDPVKETKMFAGLTLDPLYYAEEAMTFNHRDWGITLETFEKDEGLGSFFKPTALTTDPMTGDTVVATMEAFNYPFFGTQFHPEKAAMMYSHPKVNHSWASINYNRYFADRFIELTRQNTNSCGDFSTCQKLIIENSDLYVTDSYHGNVYAW